MPQVTTVIGLEVHVQLRTRTKLFCGCRAEFGADANTLVCPVCLGLPGALPVLNEAAVEFAIRAGMSLHCETPATTKWDRKQYFYPDLPKGYQISQFDLPVCVDGYLDIPVAGAADDGRRIGILRAHLEEDAGKSMHDESAGGGDSRVDLNRCGTPLLEIVSHPDLRTSDEAKAYLIELKSRMTHLGISDCEMQEGSLRVDANVNLHIVDGDKKIATPIVEVKNMNSFRAVGMAIDHEVERQYEAWEENGLTIDDVGKTTRGWDENKEQTFLQREKEESADYRYFPDPDLVPVRIGEEQLNHIRKTLGELPGQTRERLEGQYQIKAYDADVIVSQGPAFVRYFETAATIGKDGKRASGFVTGDVLRWLKERSADIDAYPVSAETMGDVVGRVRGGQLDHSRARDVISHLETHGGTADDAVQKLGIESVDDSEIESLCRELLAANPQVADDYRDGKKQAIGSLIGQARKKNANANPGTVRETLIRLIEAS